MIYVHRVFFLLKVSKPKPPLQISASLNKRERKERKERLVRLRQNVTWLSFLPKVVIGREIGGGEVGERWGEVSWGKLRWVEVSWGELRWVERWGEVRWIERWGGLWGLAVPGWCSRARLCSIYRTKQRCIFIINTSSYVSYPDI